ncbi:Hypothetical predicted protein [Olea europaea subsp. europaea]|uniref:Uncharacterized protein n=1 Tax=Olea europaea subsp. europaea TaxID=158383 RepID=A0A8S0PPY3_OLEEU|nr:Hypothetical predicted protein [Olea europaea subsp. europaea]
MPITGTPAGVAPSSDRKLVRVGMCRSPRLQSLQGRCLWQRRVLAVAVMYAHFLAPSGIRCVGHVRDEDMFSGICRQFRGQGHVQDASWLVRGRKMIFRYTKEAWCAGHVRDAGTFPGISGLFLGRVSGHGMQAIFWTLPGYSRDTAWVPSISKQFLGHGVQTMSKMRPCPGLVLATTRCKQIFRHTKAARCQDMSGMQERSQAFRGYFWGTVCRPHPEHVLATPDLQAFLGDLWAWCTGHVQGVAQLSGISRQFLGHSVQAMFGKRPGHGGQVVSRHGVLAISGCVLAAIGM